MRQFFSISLVLLHFVICNTQVFAQTSVDVYSAEQLHNVFNHPHNISEVNFRNNITLNSASITIWNQAHKITFNGNRYKLTIETDLRITGNAEFVFNCELSAKNIIIADNQLKVEFTNESKVSVIEDVSITNDFMVIDGEFEARDIKMNGGGSRVGLAIGKNSVTNVRNITSSGDPSIYVDGRLNADNVRFDNSSFAEIVINPDGVVAIKKDLEVKVNKGLSIKGGGLIGVEGNASIENSGLNMEENSQMFVDGDFNIKNGKSDINGALNVNGNFTIEWANNNPDPVIQTTQGTGVINAFSSFYCKDGNGVEGQPCIDQLGNHFPISNINTTNSGQYVNPLPIVLSYFGAVLKPNCTNIYWTTESETNNDYFTIYRSVDGVDYEPIAEVQGAGNSTIVQNYTFVDYEPLEGVSYYVLGQTDYDGEMKYSKPVAVERGANEVNIYKMALYPNPYNNNGLTIDFGFPLSCRAKVVITNMVGNVVSQVECNLSGNELRLMPNLKSGVYFVTAFVGSKTITQKLVVE